MSLQKSSSIGGTNPTNQTMATIGDDEKHPIHPQQASHSQ